MPRKQKPITPEQRAESARLKAEVEALAIKHLPHGLDSQAFYDSLEGDTELLWKLDRAGEALQELLVEHPETLQQTLSLTAVSFRTAPHLLDADMLSNHVDQLEALIAPLLEGEIPHRLSAKPAPNGSLPSFFHINYVHRALAVVAFQRLRTGYLEQGEQALERLLLLGLKSAPSNVLDLYMTTCRRFHSVGFLTGCLEAGLVGQAFVDRMVRDAWENPPHSSLATPGEVAFIMQAPDDQEDPLVDCSASVYQGLIDSLDPGSVFGRLEAGGIGMAGTELDCLSSYPWLTAICHSMREQAEWELLGMDCIRRERGIEWSADPEAPAVSTWHLLWRMWWGSRETIEVGEGLACDQLRIGLRAQGRRLFHSILTTEWNRLMVPEAHAFSLIQAEPPDWHEDLLTPTSIRLGAERMEHHLTDAGVRIVARRRRGKRAKSRPRVRDGLLAWLVRPA